VNPRSERLAELIGAQRRRIHLPRLWELHDVADPASAGSVERRRLLAEALAELVAAGVITRSVADDGGRPPLPRHVDRVTAPKLMPARPVVLWHADLWWAAERRLTEKQFQVLEAVNEWIFKQRAGAAEVPLRERALQVTGDEKAFDGGLVADGTLTLEVLRARRVVLRLHVERVGDGPVCLVVENSDTFDSLCRALARDPGPVGRVGWGAGNAFASSVLWLRADPPGAIRYFGDLDEQGLRIPAGASELAVKEGLPPVRPATGLYAALFDHGRPGSAREVLADRARDAVAWLAEEHRDRAQTLLVSGRRLAQEAVGRDVLEATDGWRDGLGP
jgi:Protein of unknown function C-terminus (DUF2399)